MILHWPRGAHDRIALPGQPSKVILAEALPVLRAHDHEEIVFWIGTAHLWSSPTRAAAERLLADTATAVAAAGARPYLVIGPLCPSYMSAPARREFDRVNATLADRYGERYLDPARVLGLPGGPYEKFRDDGVHLLDQAYWPLMAAVDERLNGISGGPGRSVSGVAVGGPSGGPTRRAAPEAQ